MLAPMVIAYMILCMLFLEAVILVEKLPSRGNIGTWYRGSPLRAVNDTSGNSTITYRGKL